MYRDTKCNRRKCNVHKAGCLFRDAAVVRILTAAREQAKIQVEEETKQDEQRTRESWYTEVTKTSWMSRL